VFGIVSISGGLLALILPETNKRPLPQTIEDIEAWYKPVAQPDNPNPKKQSNGHVATNGNDIVRSSNGSVVASRATEPRGVLENRTNGGVNRELDANEDDITVL